MSVLPGVAVEIPYVEDFEDELADEFVVGGGLNNGQATGEAEWSVVDNGQGGFAYQLDHWVMSPEGTTNNAAIQNFVRLPVTNLAGNDFKISVEARVIEEASLNAFIGLFAMNTEGMNAIARSSYNMRFFIAGHNSGRIRLDRSGTQDTNLYNTEPNLVIDTETTYTLTLSGTYDVNGALTIEAAATDGTSTVTSTRVDPEPLVEPWFGLLGQMNVVSSTEPEAQIVHFDNLTFEPIVTEEVLPLSIVAEGEGFQLSWPSQPGMLYAVRSSAALSSEVTEWTLVEEDLAAAETGFNTYSIAETDEARFFVVEEYAMPPVVLLEEGFEGADGSLPSGWTTGANEGDGMATAWEVGSPIVTGPEDAFGGSHCIGTNLSGDYGLHTDIWLRTPEIDLTGVSEASLVFQQFRDIEEEWDWGAIRVLRASDGTPLGDELVSAVDGTGTEWEERTYEFPPEAMGEAVKVEFQFKSDHLGNEAGWYLDDVMITVPAG
ncbi:MAG: choice-of-anchor J domain-containing protein [Verrucomicrobiota bacterium JB023]|nr:choice-of-anchor J domain-containing protein [Verrucomicrobiota bacterium JB023]